MTDAQKALDRGMFINSSDKEIVSAALQHAEDNTIKQGTMVYNPHLYEIVEKEKMLGLTTPAANVMEKEFISVLSPILSGQSIGLVLERLRNFYPNGIRIVP